MKKQTCSRSIQVDLASALSVTSKKIHSTFTALVLATVVSLLAGSAQAATYYWQGADGANDYWTNFSNWVLGDKNYVADGGTGVVPTVLPGASDDVVVQYNGSAVLPQPPADLNGVSQTIASLDFYYGSNVIWIDDTVGGATLTVSGTLDCREGSPQFNVPIIAGDIQRYYRGCNFTFHKQVTVNDFIEWGGAWTFHQPLSVTNKIYHDPSGGGAGSVNMNAALTCPLVELRSDLVVGASNFQYAQFNANVDGAAGGSGTTFDLGPAGFLNLAVAQTSIPKVTTQKYGGILGDFTGATYGPGNVDLVEDAILSGTLVNPPVDPTPTVADAKYWMLAGSSTGIYTASDDPNSIFKGIAFSGGVMSGGDVNATFGTTPGSSENLQVLLIGGAKKKAGGFTWLSDTGIADILCNGTYLGGNTGGINENYGVTGSRAVTNFNFHYIGASSEPNLQRIYYHDGGGKILAGQMFNIMAGKVDMNRDGGIDGTVAMADQTMLDLTSKNLNASATTQINLADGAAISINRTNQDAIETIDSVGGQIATAGDYAVVFPDNGTMTIDDTANPKLKDLRDGATQIGLNRHDNKTWTFDGDGIYLQDGQFLTTAGYQNKYTKILAASIFGADPSATTIGLASDAGQYLDIECSITNIATKELMINSTTLQIVTQRNYRDTADGIVRFYTAVSPATLNIQDGELEAKVAQTWTDVIADGLLDAQSQTIAISGTLSGNGTVASPANLTFNTVAPGNSVGNLTFSSAFNVPVGATYEWEMAATDTAGVTYDLITVAGAVTFGGAWTLQIADGGFPGILNGSEVFTIIAGTSVPVDFIEPTISTAGTGYSGGTVSVVDNNVILTGLTGIAAASPAGTIFFIK